MSQRSRSILIAGLQCAILRNVVTVIYMQWLAIMINSTITLRSLRKRISNGHRMVGIA